MRRATFALAIAVSVATAASAQQRPAITADDYAEIRQLYARTGMLLDNGAEGGAAYARLFTADATVQDEAGAQVTGRDRIVAVGRGTSPKAAAETHHFIYNVRVDSTPQGVIGQAYLIVATLNEQGQPATVTHGGKFRDELVKTSEGWRIKARRFTPAIGAAPGAAPVPAAAPPR